MDGSDDEPEADEDLDHLESAEAVPRSDADHLKQLNSLGITAEVLDLDVAEEVGTSELEEDQTFNAQVGQQSLTAGPHWFKVELQNLIGALLQPAGMMDVMDVMDVRHCLMRACNCHIEISEESTTAHIFASSSEVASKAKYILGLSVDEVKRLMLQQHSASSIPEDLEEEENLDSLDMSWTAHPSHSTFSHYSVRPSFVDATVQSFQPTLRSWTFTHQLDPVQLRAIACVENDESVLLCAPTSAGKTAVATYAVAMALHRKRRAIYTTPVKALSNQKFLELGKSFGGQYIGIMTGDTVIASDAPIVVMTLEILQGMLYKQARDPNLLDDFQCVVIDEAHFLGDLDRGYAWEEVLILLPPHVKLVLLSATVPNSRTIADWCARVRMQPMHLVTSDQRPVPFLRLYVLNF